MGVVGQIQCKSGNPAIAVSWVRSSLGVLRCLQVRLFAKAAMLAGHHRKRVSGMQVLVVARELETYEMARKQSMNVGRLRKCRAEVGGWEGAQEDE